MTDLLKTALIDSHCHLNFPVFDADRSMILQTCREHNITAIVIPGVCRKDWQGILTLCHDQAMLFPALGLHPCFTDEHSDNDLDRLAQLCASESLTAIGEIGLDFFENKKFENKNFNNNIDRDSQCHYFSEQLQIAGQYQLPVLIHARKSHDEVIKYLKQSPSLRGIIHAYSGSYEQAKEYLKLGFKLGFGGAFTYPKATKLRSLLLRLPLDAWVLETDAPDMSPLKHHGKKNSPQYLTEIAQEFIQLYDAESESSQIIEQLFKNTLDVLPTISFSVGKGRGANCV
ncbi:MAG: TatD family hydrolase [Gammaproteobacteria bacterium]|nr:TatD family hydrolase [Gammaproteobacteria bacterium]